MGPTRERKPDLGTRSRQYDGPQQKGPRNRPKEGTAEVCLLAFISGSVVNRFWLLPRFHHLDKRVLVRELNGKCRIMRGRAR